MAQNHPFAQRSLAPDLARGFMLLIIAIVHAHMFRQLARDTGVAVYDGFDVPVTIIMLMFAENRGYPMFAALFGYGLAQIYLRRRAEGHEWPWIRSLLRRRGRWMVLIGFLHVLLLFYGDIISVYGLMAIIFAFLVKADDRRLLTHGMVWLLAGTLAYAAISTALFMTDVQSEALKVTALLDMGYRLASWPVALVMFLLISIFPFTIGIWAARRRLMEEPESHIGFLRLIALAGIAVAALGGLPHALMVTDIWSPDAVVRFLARWVHVVTGYAGGFGYAALIGLIVVRLGSRRGPVVNALKATGQRSMSCYLLQSVAWLILFMPYTLNLAPRVSDLEIVLIGAGVWLTTVVLAAIMDRANFQGPMEGFLRRRTYNAGQ